MKPFVLDDLTENIRENKTSEFITYFDKEQSATRQAVGKDEDAADAEEQSRKAFEDAFVQGEKAGYEMGMKKVETVIRRLNGYISDLSFFKEELLERSRKLSTELALVFTEAIILRECDEKRETVLRMAKKALDLCEERNDIVIRIRKEDADRISPDEVSHLRIVRDDTLKEPGFIIETNFGDIDGRISVQLEELKKEYANGKFD
jgi:flagellar assembly protein FliH